MLNKANQGFSESDGMLSDCNLRINQSIHNAGVGDSSSSIATIYRRFRPSVKIFRKVKGLSSESLGVCYAK